MSWRFHTLMPLLLGGVDLLDEQKISCSCLQVKTSAVMFCICIVLYRPSEEC